MWIENTNKEKSRKNKKVLEKLLRYNAKVNISSRRSWDNKKIKGEIKNHEKRKVMEMHACRAYLYNAYVVRTTCICDRAGSIAQEENGSEFEIENRVLVKYNGNAETVRHRKTSESQKSSGKGDTPKTRNIDVGLYIAGLAGVFAVGYKKTAR